MAGIPNSPWTVSRLNSTAACQCGNMNAKRWVFSGRWRKIFTVASTSTPNVPSLPLRMSLTFGPAAKAGTSRVRIVPTGVTYSWLMIRS